MTGWTDESRAAALAAKARKAHYEQAWSGAQPHMKRTTERAVADYAQRTTVQPHKANLASVAQQAHGNTYLGLPDHEKTLMDRWEEGQWAARDKRLGRR